MIATFEKLILAGNGRWVAIGLIIIAVWTLGLAIIAEYGFHLEPCILCLYQRVPFAVAGVLGVLSLLLPAWRWQLALLAGIAFLAGSGIAVYHVGVEQHWWVSAAGCGVGDAKPLSFAEMQQSLTQKTRKSCDEVDWTLFGISMATYNVLYSAALGLVTIRAAQILRKQA